MKELIVESFALIMKRLEEMLLITDATQTIYSADFYPAGLEILESAKPDLGLFGINSGEEKSITFLNGIKTLNKTSLASFRRYLH